MHPQEDIRKRKQMIEMKTVLLVVIMLVALILPASALYNETNISVIEDTIITQYPQNQTWDIQDSNGSLVYHIQIPDIYTKTVPVAMDITLGMQIVQTFSVAIIALIMTIRSVYMLMSWISSRRV